MSRSVHDTHGVLRRILDEDYADPELKRALASEVRANIRRQRTIKARVQEQRGHEERPPLPPFDPALAPVIVTDAGPYVHHAATEEDIREVMRRMPPGSLDGLGPIHLCLGKGSRHSDDDTPDPYTGRLGLEVLPGVYCGSVLGVYFPEDCRVHIHAYVHEAGAAGPLAFHLKLVALATLVHELSHHFDRAFRTRGDRWRMDDVARDEHYADSEQLERVRTCVVPYLIARYPDEYAAFRRWEARHGGCELPLDAYTNGASAALEALAGAVAAGGDPLAARGDFGLGLYRCGRHDDALGVADAMLAERPGDLDAHYIRALVAHLRGQYDVAQASLLLILSEPDPPARAEAMMGQILCHQERWEELAAHATRALARHTGRGIVGVLLEHRGRARIEQGQAQEEGPIAAREIAALRRIDENAIHVADALVALRLLRGGEWESAFAAADRLLRIRELLVTTRAEVLAIRLESALRLGRLDAACMLDERIVARLRRLGRGPWVDRLLAELGPR